MSDLKTTIKRMIARWAQSDIPTRQATVTDSRTEPPAMARGMTVEFIHGVIAAAEAGQTRDLFALYRDMIATDSHLQAEIAKRKLAVLGDALQFLPYDKTLTADVEAAAAVESAMFGMPGWIRACSFLLDGSLYPLSVAEKCYKPTGAGYALAGLIQVPYQLLDFADGRLMIFDQDPSNGQSLGTKHEPDPERYIVHRGHLLTMPDNWGGPMRSVLFWWLLSIMDREWWSKFLDRYGAPFLVGTFQDEEGRTILERAFALASRLGGLAVSEGTNVEIKQAAASDSGDAFDRFHAICQREKSKLVIGQTLSSESQPTGIGTGASVIQEGVRQDIRRFDARMLAETIRDQLVVQFCRINRMTGNPPTLAWGSESDAKLDSTVKLLKALTEAHLQVDDNALAILSEIVGMGIERAASSPGFTPAFSATACSAPHSSRVRARHLDAIADAGAAGVAQAFRASFAPVARIVRESSSAAECEERIREYCSGWRPDRVSTLVAEALSAYAANGSVPRDTPDRKTGK